MIHDYARHYAKHFDPIRDKCISLLEIGVDEGKSINTWLEYFPKATICGIDDIARGYPVDPRYTFVHGDQADEGFLIHFGSKHGSDWDIIIDDGGHHNREIILSFMHLWPLVRPGGLYCIEDLGVHYIHPNRHLFGLPPHLVHTVGGYPTALEWLRSLIDEMNCGRGNIDEFSLTQELAILRKKS